MKNDYLFCSGYLHEVVASREQLVKAEVEELDKDRLLNTPSDALVEYLVEKYRFNAPRLQEDRINTAENEAKVDVTGDFRYISIDDERIVVPGTTIQFFIPFAGDPDLFKFRPSTFTSNPPRAAMCGSELVVTITGVGLTPDGLRVDLNKELQNIRQYLSSVESTVKSFNDSLPGIARQCVEGRRQRLLSAAGLVASLGFPLRTRSDTARTFAPPEIRRKLARSPPTSTVPFKPEPALASDDYEHILGVLRSMARVLERNPSAFARMEEEHLRDHFLVHLNGHYEGQATGETFNASGKTDILVRSGDRNIFVAECKFWHGPAEFAKAIDQLLGYLTWRDTKTAILLFNRQRNFSAVLEKIPPTYRNHASFRRDVTFSEESSFRFVASNPSDFAREITVTVLAFDVPQ